MTGSATARFRHPGAGGGANSPVAVMPGSFRHPLFGERAREAERTPEQVRGDVA